MSKEQITPEQKELFIKIYNRLTKVNADELRHLADYGAIMPDLWDALQEISKYGLSTPVTDEQETVCECGHTSEFHTIDEDELTGCSQCGCQEFIPKKEEAVTDEQLQNDLDELIEAVLNDKLYGTSAPGTGRPHDPDPAISEIKERILRKHSVTPVLSEPCRECAEKDRLIEIMDLEIKKLHERD